MATQKRNLYNKKKKHKTSKINWLAWLDLLTDKRTRTSLGLLLMAVSVAMLLSFVSYFYTGQADQSLVEGSGSLPGERAQNWLGRVGATLSYYFVFRWFGVSAFLLVPLVFNAGYRVVANRELFPQWQIAKMSAFFIFWVSTFLGYLVLFTDSRYSLGFLCGGIGYGLAQVFHNMIGWATLLLLVLVLAVYLVFSLDVDDLIRQRLALRTANDEGPATPQAPKTAPEPVLPQPPPTNQFEVPPSWQKNAPAKYPAPLENELEITLANNLPINRPPAYNPNYTAPPVPEPEDDGQLPVPYPQLQQPAFSVEDMTAAEPKNGPPKSPLVAVADEDDDDGAPAYVRYGLYDPTLELGSYKYPTLDLLDPPTQNKVKVTKEELEANKDRIVETLSNFRIGISSIKATIGPTVTLYEIVPQPGVKISRIKTLEDDIALNLSALGIRIIAPIPGRGTIGIEVPNKNREMVAMSSIITSEKFVNSDKALPVVLGKTISNEVFVTDLAKMPHLLMAGATGQGKSVGLNVILASLLYKRHPAELKFVLVDPKKVELTLFNRIERHFLATLPNAEESIITDTRKVIHTLNSLCIEMDVRYNLLKEAGCRNIKEYNHKFTKRGLNPEDGHRFLPYIVLIIDELADLMMTAGKEIETPIARLAQLARAIGIHLVVATQRPSVNVITGIIKANFPARLSFKVSSRVDSRTILDTNGAEQLVGQGDMLLSNGSDIIRLQCAFVDTHEVERICDFIGEQRGYDTSYLLPEFEDEGAESKAVDLDNRDSMFEDAARLVVQHQQGSTSLIQRKLSLGYNRAGRIMDQLEAAGVVGAFEGSKARKVLVGDEYALEQLLNNLT
ncbi:MAG: DNA translocase FtsK [Bernardetiaceae bacterium]|jgi:S-DNA-T family DNA segregation ATPase FtsK/SpoIIIE|nr:DNA translocase FtsK [Bernardetiaceae bacterium]